MRRSARLLLVAAALAIAGCARERVAMTAGEAELVAWWIEDVAHGRNRDPSELVAEGASEGLLRVAEWARGTEPSRPAPPPMVARRRERWPALSALVADQAVTSDAGTGALAVAPRAESADRSLATSLIKAENGDRSAIDYTVLTLGRAGDAGARRYRTAVRDARVHWDTRR